MKKRAVLTTIVAMAIVASILTLFKYNRKDIYAANGLSIGQSIQSVENRFGNTPWEYPEKRLKVWINGKGAWNVSYDQNDIVVDVVLLPFITRSAIEP